MWQSVPVYQAREGDEVNEHSKMVVQQQLF